MDNATLTYPDNDKADFYIETSGELLTEKLQRFNTEKHWYVIPPFFQGLRGMGDPDDPNSGYENFDTFKRNVYRFLTMIETHWPKIRRINELWQNGNEKFLVQEVHNMLPKKQFPMNNRLENLRGVHSLTRFFLQPVLTFQHNEFIFSELKFFLEENPSGLIEISKYFRDHFKRYEKRVLRAIEGFTEVFKFLIPAYGLTFYHSLDQQIFKGKGITTASFEDIKEFYIDTYELAVDLLPIVVAYNNLKHRNAFTVMSDQKPQYEFEKFFEAPKGKKLEYIDMTESFDQLIVSGALDNKIRNAIGHNTYEFDGISQVIHYDPIGKNKSSDFRSIYLIEFAQKCLAVFRTAIHLWELLYQTEKNLYVSQGMKSVNPEVFNNKMSEEEVRRKKEIRRKKRAKKKNK